MQRFVLPKNKTCILKILNGGVGGMGFQYKGKFKKFLMNKTVEIRSLDCNIYKNII